MIWNDYFSPWLEPTSKHSIYATGGILTKGHAIGICIRNFESFGLQKFIFSKASLSKNRTGSILDVNSIVLFFQNHIWSSAEGTVV
ncbi:MAG: hypothetical protein Ct9H90mP14_3130 [Methanobacteriota archaeon]|nr:MAG: hypothetical protein Ct9H90mP14_3130 [Euryarchaeota archaeon]